MFWLRSSSRLWGKSTTRMFHNRPVQNTSGQLNQKASDGRLLFWVSGTLYVATAVYTWNYINVNAKELEMYDKKLEKLNEMVEKQERPDTELEMEKLNEMVERRGKELDSKFKNPGNY